MNKFFAINFCLLIFSIILFSSCVVVFEEPVFSKEEAIIDERLIGKWKTVEPDDTGLIEFVKRLDSEIEILDHNNKTGKITEAFKVLTGKIGNSNYMNLNFIDKEEGNFIAKYEIINDEMTIWILDNKKMNEFLKQIKLKGSSEGSDGIRITDTAKNIKSFLKTPQSNEIFKFFAKLRKTA